MTWTFERKLRAVVEAPLGPVSTRPDTRVVERDGWFQRISPSAPGTHLNEVFLSSVSDADAERVIDEVVATYRALGKPTKWCTGPWTRPEDFDERLARRGFTSWGTRGMGIETDAALTAPLRPESVAAVRCAETESDLDAYLRASRRGWSVDDDDLEATRASYRAAFLRPAPLGWLFVAADLGAAAVHAREGYGYLVGGAVAEDARGRGIYRALVAARLAFLRDRGVEYAVTQAREATSAPILERLGFETLFRGRCHVLE